MLVTLNACDGSGSWRKASYASDRQLGKGGAGTVFKDEAKPGIVIKMYNEALTSDNHLKPVICADVRKQRARLEHMLAYPPAHSKNSTFNIVQIAWPEEMLFTDWGDFVGFTMPAVDFQKSVAIFELTEKATRKDLVGKFPRVMDENDLHIRYRLGVARNVALIVHNVNEAGHAVCDLNSLNVRVYVSQGLACLIDCDGFRISGGNETHYCELILPDIRAQEVSRSGNKAADKHQDSFALAMLIFQLLNNGRTPFNVIPNRSDIQTGSIEANINAGYYAYGLKPHNAVQPAPGSLHEAWPTDLRQLFDRAFKPGGHPDIRPSALEWKDFLDGLLRTIGNCPKPGHGLGAKLDGKTCMFCAAEHRAHSAAHPAQQIASPPGGGRGTLTPSAAKIGFRASTWAWLFCVIVAIVMVGHIANYVRTHTSRADREADLRRQGIEKAICGSLENAVRHGDPLHVLEDKEARQHYALCPQEYLKLGEMKVPPGNGSVAPRDYAAELAALENQQDEPPSSAPFTVNQQTQATLQSFRGLDEWHAMLQQSEAANAKGRIGPKGIDNMEADR